MLLVSETHLTSKSYLKLNGFEVILANYLQTRAHGGADIIIKSNVKYEIEEPSI